MLFSAFALNAQLQKGDGLLNLGLGMSSYYTSGSGFKVTLPPLEASYETFVSDAFSVGGFAGYYGAKYENETEVAGIVIDTEIKYSYLTFGALGNYHFVNDESFNVYAGAKLGYVSASTKLTQDTNETFEEDDLISKVGATASGVIFGAHVGARYHLSESLALNAELGYGISLLKVGVSFKL